MSYNLHLPWMQSSATSCDRQTQDRLSSSSPNADGWIIDSGSPFSDNLRQSQAANAFANLPNAASPTAFSLRTSSAYRASNVDRRTQGVLDAAGFRSPSLGGLTAPILRSPSLGGSIEGAGVLTSTTHAPMLANFGGQFAGTHNPKYDLEQAFTALESCDESNINRQAELCSRMHGVLLGADPLHPRLSSVSQIDVVDSTFDDFDPDIMEFMRETFSHALEMPKRSDGWAARHLLNVVEFCQHHGGEVPIHPVFVLRVLRDVAALMAPNAHNAVREMQVPQNGQFVLVGDTHGQLEDVLWIFHKNGLPSTTNAYLFNGDVADRGRNAIEIFIMLYVGMLVYPKQVGINRGNHEDERVNMDPHCGGFYEEVMDKYGSAIGGRMWVEVIKLYSLLPLATVLNNRVFVVHGGLSRQENMLPLLKSITTRTVTLPEMPRAPPDIVCVDAMWSDPQDGPGVIASSRGQSLIQFGPDVTHQFLRDNGFQLLVRSHQPPKNKDGVFFHHEGQLVTVFSASNYCGWYGNKGGVLIFQPNLQYHVDRHFSPTFDTLRQVKFMIVDAERYSPKRRQTNAALEIKAFRVSTTRDPMKTLLRQNIRQRLARLIVENKQTLWTYFFDADTEPPHGFITVPAFRAAMTAVLGHTGAPWAEIGNISEVDCASGQVDYQGFLHRFQCVLKSDQDSGVITNWMETVLGRLYGRLMRADLGWADLCRRFDSTGTGKVSAADFRREVQYGQDGKRTMSQGGLSEEQTTRLLRTLAAHSCTRVGAQGIADVDVPELLSRLESLYTGYKRTFERTPSVLLRSPSSLCASVLRNIGKVAYQGHTDTRSANLSLQKIFADADTDLSGRLDREEFGRAVDAILSAHPEILADIPRGDEAGTLNSELVDQLFDFVDISGDRSINYLEFLHCFQVSEPVGGTRDSLRTCLMEQICTTIYLNKGALLMTFAYYDMDYARTVSRESFRRVLWSLNTSLSTTSPPLTTEQIDIIVDHLKFDANDQINYVEFLASFEVIDTRDDPSGNSNIDGI